MPVSDRCWSQTIKRNGEKYWQTADDKPNCPADGATSNKPNCPADGATAAALPRLLRSGCCPPWAARFWRRWRQCQIGTVVGTWETGIERDRLKRTITRRHSPYSRIGHIETVTREPLQISHRACNCWCCFIIICLNFFDLSRPREKESKSRYTWQE